MELKEIIDRSNRALDEINPSRDPHYFSTRQDERRCSCEPHAEPPTSGYNPRCPIHGSGSLAD